MNWWDSFWRWADTSPLGTEVVGGLIVLAIAGAAGLLVSAVVPKLRKPVFGWLAGFFRWIASLRLTTTARMRAQVDEGIAHLSDNLNTEFADRTKWVIDERLSAIRRAEQADRRRYAANMRADKAQAELVDIRIQMAAAEKQFQELSNALEIAQSDTRSEHRSHLADPEEFTSSQRSQEAAEAEVEAMRNRMSTMVDGHLVDAAYRRGLSEKRRVLKGQRAVPTKSPRWQVLRDEEGDQNDWVLSNHAEGAVATHVVLTSVHGTDFTFTGDAAWSDVTGIKSVYFTGFMSDFGRKMGVRFRIAWVDEDGGQRQEPFTYNVSRAS